MLTLETLAAIKNLSSVTFVRQANVAHGPQQVSNDSFETITRAGARRFLKSSKANNSSERMANGWTLEQRARQSVAIRQWRPWGGQPVRGLP